MSDIFPGLGFIAASAAFAFIVGASLTFGVVLVCQWLKWHPVSIVVHSHNHFRDHLLVEYEREVGK